VRFSAPASLLGPWRDVRRDETLRVEVETPRPTGGSHRHGARAYWKQDEGRVLRVRTQNPVTGEDEEVGVRYRWAGDSDDDEALSSLDEATEPSIERW
jgi:hypothetical protein